LLLFKVDSFGFVTLFAYSTSPQDVVKNNLADSCTYGITLFIFLVAMETKHRRLPSHQGRKSASILDFGNSLSALSVCHDVIKTKIRTRCE